MIVVRRALVSMHDKSGLEDFARALHEQGVELVSTGGTAARLTEAGLPVTRVSDVTGFPELFGGRVKTLHPLIHGGLLYRRGYHRGWHHGYRAGARAGYRVGVRHSQNLYRRNTARNAAVARQRTGQQPRVSTTRREGRPRIT